MSTGTVEFFFGVRAWRGRGKGTQQSFIWGGSVWRVNPLHFYTPFLTEKAPFRIPSSDKWYPFHIPILEHCIPFNYWKCTVLKIRSTKPERFLDFFHNHKKCVCYPFLQTEIPFHIRQLLKSLPFHDGLNGVVALTVDTVDGYFFQF